MRKNLLWALAGAVLVSYVGCGPRSDIAGNGTKKGDGESLQENVKTEGNGDSLQEEAAAVKEAVLEPQEAGWGRHDFGTYMTQWTDNAQHVYGREERPGKYDIVCERKQIEATRRLLMHGKPPEDRKLVFDNVQVKVQGDEAELRLRVTYSFGENYEMTGELYRLRKTPAGWKVSLNRGWPLKTKFGKDVTAFDADTWKKLDSEADELVRMDKRGDRAAQALIAAHRFREAHDLLEKVTARKDAPADDWMSRGWVALNAGDADDALSAFRNALKSDESTPVPEFAREIQKE